MRQKHVKKLKLFLLKDVFYVFLLSVRLWRSNISAIKSNSVSMSLTFFLHLIFFLTIKIFNENDQEKMNKTRFFSHPL